MHYALLSPESSIIVTAAPTTGVDIDVFFLFLSVFALRLLEEENWIAVALRHCVVAFLLFSPEIDTSSALGALFDRQGD